ncbi:MAG: hypothetical protein K0Q90_2856, partial [Paenibacillaceae bacterium]|nr:hypothetical protein [Paenibacillaceae bacterium]
NLDDSIIIRKPTYLMRLRQRYLKPQQLKRRE